MCPSCQAGCAEGTEICGSCGQLLLGEAALAPSTVVASRYEILSLLGRGGMGTVYKARDRALEDTVAVKILRSDVAEDLAKRFRSEIKLARRVRHRNVCGIHEYGEDGRLRYITMEFIEGTDLKRLLREHGPLAAQEAFDVAIQLAKGLQAIHDTGIIHRDLKTSNVMMDRNRVVRLMDFGIAKQVGPEATATATAVGHILGTPEYMSPEQARGEKIDLRSDLYALGIVIYEIFTGDVPFHGVTPIATIYKQIQDPVPLDGPAAERIPRQLTAVLKKAMAKEPSARYGSAKELADAMRQARAATFPSSRSGAWDADDVVEPLTETVAMTEGDSPTHTGITRPVPPRPPAVAATVTDSPALLPPAPEPTMVVVATTPTPAVPTPRPPEITWPPPPPIRVPPTVPSRAVRHETAARPTSPRRSVVPWLLALGLVVGLLSAGVVLGLRSLLSPDQVEVVDPGETEPTPSPAPPTPAPTPEPPTPEPPTPAPPTPMPPTPAPPTPLPPSPVPPTPMPPTPVPPTPRPPTPAPPTPVPPTPQPPTPAPPLADGLLQLRVRPWAEVVIDGTVVGQTPLRPVSLPPGRHTVQLRHPDFKPLTRKVTIESGSTFRLEIDLTWEAVPR
jgi:serine/threonine-protein kinase